MKSWFFSILLLLAVVSVVYAQPAAQENYRVLIDPAHGGADSGVSLSSRTAEKEITLAIALSLKKNLETGGSKIKVQMTRSADKTVSLEDRIKMVKMLKPDVVISLHTNAGFGTEASGFEITLPGQGAEGGNTGNQDIVTDMEKTKYVNNSIRLAQMVQKHLETIFPRKGRGNREVPVPILASLSAPSICVELGFLTSKLDKEKLQDEDVQKDIARALGQGIRDYLNL